MLKCLAAALALGAATLSSVEAALNVHIVCHTHDDVGWLKTVDQYFKGANSTIQHASVQYILDSVILALQANPLRKFIYVEQAFFQRWYREQDSDTKKTVKRLVANGQLEFINGGWCMHDEAATHYVDMIDQTTLGHRFIKSEFGQIPRVGWQIDPFGHSSTQASLLSAEVGFDGLFFGRMDYQDHDIRMKEQNMEFVWRASPSMGSSAEIFTKAFQNGNYGPPDGFCFDQSCDDAQPIQDDPLLEDYNVQDRVNGFVAQALQQSKATKGNNIMFTMGSDFQYENANEWFKNLDKLIEYVNRDGRVNAFYSTPSQYLDAKFEEEIVFSVKTDDFFPYADNEHAYWTGYFTSRPALKRYVRMTSGLLQAFRQIEAFGGGDGSSTEALYQAQGVAQHHDAVSGTSRQHVAYDYAKRISKGVDIATVMTQANIGNWLVKGSSTPPVLSNCFLTNISVCATSQSQSSFVVVAYNPLARSRTELISIPYPFSKANVTDSNGVVLSQATPILNNSAIPSDAAPYVLRFMATIPALGYSSFAVVPVPSSLEPSTPVFSVENHDTEKDDEDEGDDDDEDIKPDIKSDIKSDDSPSISNGLIRVDFQSGLVSQITNLTSKTSVNLKQEFLWYASYADAPGDNTNPSGAYIFRPNSTSAYPVSSQSSATIKEEGPLVWEIHQVIASWLTQIVRLKANSYEVEFEYTVGSIPIDDGVGKEVIIRYTSSLDSKGEMITDSNGRETLLRTFGTRPTWNWTTLEPVAGNYYPVNAFASISDSSNQLTILTDRSQGVASLSGGQMEFMVHRRVLHDDARGVTEPLNETDSAIYTIKDGNVVVTRVGNGLIITGTHTLLFSPASTAAFGYRTLQQRLFAPLFLSFTPFSGSGKDWFNAHTATRSFCKTELPLNVELMTLQPWGKSQILLRLAHNFAVNEDPKYSSSVSVDLASLFSKWTIKSVTEMSLTANQPLADVKRLKWNTLTKKQNVKRGFLQGTVVTLTPMEIVTLLVDIDN